MQDGDHGIQNPLVSVVKGKLSANMTASCMAGIRSIVSHYDPNCPEYPKGGWALVVIFFRDAQALVRDLLLPDDPIVVSGKSNPPHLSATNREESGRKACTEVGLGAKVSPGPSKARNTHDINVRNKFVDNARRRWGAEISRIFEG